MTACADRLLRWCERHYRPKGAEKFSIEGREWVRDEFFVPAMGWKLWPKDPDRLCEKCRKRIGEWHDWSPALIRSLKAHRDRSKKCRGLWLAPNMVTIENIDRGVGKTCNSFALVAALLDDPELAPFTVHFMAAAGSQTDTLVQENLLDPIAADKRLKKRFRHIGNKIQVEHRRPGRRVRSYLEFVETSHRSATGRRRNLLYIEEARDVPGRPFAALLPSIKGQSRLVCVMGHAERPYEDDLIAKCPVCKQVMVPKIPRVIIVSTSGMQEGGETDWFDELVDLRTESPSPYVHIFRSDDAGNPSASHHETDMLTEVFADVEGLRDYLAAELENQPRRKGDDFIGRTDIRRIQRKNIVSLDGSILECVGFLDTSWSSDLTSIVLAGWDPEESEWPWHILRVLHWQIWTPKRLPGGVIDPTGIRAHLDRHLPLFPNLRMLMVDDRGQQWAKDLVIYCNKHRNRTWGKRVFLFHGKRVRNAKGRLVREGARIHGLYGGEEDRSRSWQMLHYRIVAQPDPRVLIPTDPLFEKELRGVTKIVKSDGTVEIRDRNRRKRHAEVVDSLAGCCLLAYLLQTNQVRRLTDTTKSGRSKELLAHYKPIMSGLDPRRSF